MDRTTKVILEDIDEAELQISRDEVELKGILNTAKAAGRELYRTEDERINNGVHRAKQTKQRLSQLRNELQAAEQVNREIVSRSKMNSNTTVYNSYGKPEQVLPINGQLPGESTAGLDRIYVRAAKLKAFTNEREAFSAGMWYRAIAARLDGRGDSVAEENCRRFGLEITNAAYEGSGTAGGYLVPPQISQTIIDVRERVGIARQVCQIQPMSGDMVSIPKRSGGLTVYYPNELQTITDSDKSWQQIALAAEKRAVASKISQELVDDALISIIDNVVSEQAYALALQEDNELCNGTGASTYGGVIGLRSSIGSAGVYSCDANENLWSEIDLEDVIATMRLLPDRFNRNPVWICSSNFYLAVFFRLMAAAGGNNIASLQAGDGGRRSFFGVPVLTTSQMPTADADSTIHALYGQFDMGVILADRLGIRIGRDDSTGFLSDYTTIKATSRYDIKVHEPGNSSNAGDYVALKTVAA